MKSRTLRLLYVLAAAGLVVSLGFVYALLCSYVYLAPTLPTVRDMRSNKIQEPLRVYTRSGQLISQIGEQRQIPLAYEEIPQIVREAFIAAEDDRFFEHGGIDYAGVLRALFVNVTGDGRTQGASTITMQAARSMFFGTERTIRRKLQEVFITLRMEHEFDKQEILKTYLNVIFFGQRAYGVAAAAEVYYGKPLDQLTLGEIATLAGVPQSPSRFNPATDPKAAARRRSYVLRRMQELNYIDEGSARRAEEQPILSREFALRNDVEGLYVAEMARQHALETLGEGAIGSGVRVITTVDSRLQAAATRAVRLGLIEYDRRHGYRGPLKRLKPPAADADSEQLDELLDGFAALGNLRPAIVLAVGEQSARVHVRSEGRAELGWDGLSWAVAEGRPAKAADILTRGDVVYVVSNGRGSAHLAQRPEAQAALVALDPLDGAVVALVGGFDYIDNKFNRATQANRQPGSGFKPFLYSAALDQGITPADMLLDAPTMMDDSNTERVWRPENSGGQFSGPMSLRNALVRSRNLVAIRLIRKVGNGNTVSYASRFGFDPKTMPREDSLALGTLPAKPLQMAAGYAVFANEGHRVEPYFVDRIEDSMGKVLWQHKRTLVCELCEGGSPAPGSTAAQLPSLLPQSARAERAISAANAWIMTDLMADVIRRGTGRRALALGRDDLAGKTGTTQETRDTWFNGFNRDLVASVWVGFDQERSLGEGEEGSTTAAPIWVNFMREALRGVPERKRAMPTGVVTGLVMPDSGQLAQVEMPGTISEYFLAEHLPETAEFADPAATLTNPDSGASESLF